MSERSVITVSTFAEAREVYRQKSLRQALYDAGDVVMADVLVNLHGAQHRDRRRLENRLFRKDTHARCAAPSQMAMVIGNEIQRVEKVCLIATGGCQDRVPDESHDRFLSRFSSRAPSNTSIVS